MERDPRRYEARRHDTHHHDLRPPTVRRTGGPAPGDGPREPASPERRTARTRAVSAASDMAIPFDPDEFAARIQAEWDAVAEDWGRDHWRAFVEAGAGGVSERLLEMARLGEGDRVLDLGTGVGEPAGLAARRVGAAGRVVGVDLSPRMVEIGNRRLARLGLRNVELQVADAGRPPFPDGSFDVALSRWVLMLVPDLPAALRRIRRVLRPGGRLAVGLWGHPERVPMISGALRLAESMFPMPPQPEDAPTHLWHRGADAFCELLRDAGFDEVEADAVDVVFQWETPAAYAEFITAMAGPLRVAADSLPPDLARRLREGLEGIAREVAGDGPLRLANETLCISGRRE